MYVQAHHTTIHYVLEQGVRGRVGMGGADLGKGEHEKENKEVAERRVIL